jgi:hypothetical protein
MQDDDCDGLTDCMDPDCTNVTPCRPARKDPTLIKFSRNGGLDLLRGHATLDMAPVDVNTQTVGVLLANQTATLYIDSLPPGSFVPGPSGTIFRFRNPDARYTGGLYSVKIKQRRDGSAYTFSFSAYADLSAAEAGDADPLMQLQFYIGLTDRPFITIDTPWTRTPSGWRAPKDH